jgi:hypothetical protein
MVIANQNGCSMQNGGYRKMAETAKRRIQQDGFTETTEAVTR